ncbi:MAG: glycosyltransferase family 39 protein [Gaiellales bacterium]
MSGRLWLTLATAGALAVGAALPAVWWEPLHVDEAVTLTLAPLGLGEIVDTVFVEKGGAPLHFFVEHALLEWPGGLEGIRLPSLVFFLLALPAAALVGRELVGEWEAALGTLLLALAPLAVSLATFGRMYTLFLAAVLWATWGVLLAARTGGWVPWALAGAAAGLLVYVHPVAPPYIALVLATGVLLARAPLRDLAARAGIAAGAALVAGLPYYLVALDRLRDRYGVHLDRPRLETTAGRSVPEESIHALTPGGTAGTILLLLLALAGLAGLAFRRPRGAMALALWIVVPIAFFWLVPAGDTRFFDRYLVPALPFFLLALAAGCLLPWRLTPRALPAAAVLALGVAGWQAYDNVDRLRELRALRLSALVDAVEPYESEGVLFPSSGRAVAGRPSTLLDTYVRLELPGLEPDRRDGVGLWIFRASSRRLDRLAGSLPSDLGVQRPAPHFLLAVSAVPVSDEALEAQDALVRGVWEASED